MFKVKTCDYKTVKKKKKKQTNKKESFTGPQYNLVIESVFRSAENHLGGQAAGRNFYAGLAVRTDPSEKAFTREHNEYNGVCNIRAQF